MHDYAPHIHLPTINSTNAPHAVVARVRRSPEARVLDQSMKKQLGKKKAGQLRNTPYKSILPLLDKSLSSFQVGEKWNHTQRDNPKKSNKPRVVCILILPNTRSREDLGWGLGSEFWLTPSLRGMTHFQTMRFTDPSGSVSGFATNP